MFNFSVFVRVQRGCVPLQNRERDGLDTKGLANLFPDGLTEAAAWSILLSLCPYGTFLILGYYQSNHGICGGPYRDGFPLIFQLPKTVSREKAQLWAGYSSSPHLTRLTCLSLIVTKLLITPKIALRMAT